MIIKQTGDLYHCGECKKLPSDGELIQIGERLDWESQTALICWPCLEKGYNSVKLARSIKNKEGDSNGNQEEKRM